MTGKVDARRAFCTKNAFACIMLQERERVHPNMVSVRDWLEESSSTDLREVEGR
jgi:hypothetical protein